MGGTYAWEEGAMLQNRPKEEKKTTLTSGEPNKGKKNQVKSEPPPF